jgi:hypothetical protein
VAEPLDGSRFQPGCIVGKALADITEPVVATIEVVVGKS